MEKNELQKESALKIIFSGVKFVTLALFCVLLVLIVNHFCQIKEYSATLSKNIKITVFFDNKNVKDSKNVIEAIEATQLVSVKEYVNASEAFERVIERNLSLRGLSASDDVKSMQAYAVVVPKIIPDENFLLKVKRSLSGILGVDEVVYDALAFKHYVKIETLRLFCQKMSCVFIIAISILFTLKTVCFALGKGLIKVARNILPYFVASAFGFFAIWISQYSLVISGSAILYTIFFAAIIGALMDSV